MLGSPMLLLIDENVPDSLALDIRQVAEYLPNPIAPCRQFCS
jgi:hypothetical protein